ncbi:leucine-rich repeat-containing protein 1-like [Actinia tenebrosa]|uniref:Leucine-rich repeat-containing protein 1-like n=1 Tax=Actinia tenebrosa TaxID=6105 RepID=A0A6P8ILA3_ACTTE|nr:leucine-rich repeat-containing protein 1-like [Actinia tenebrosa]
MDSEKSFNEKLEELVKTHGDCLCLDSLDLDVIPVKWFTELQESSVKISVLKLEYNDIYTLPEAIGLLSTLEELYLTGNQLVSLPNAVGDLKCLKQLHMNENCLKALPETLGELHSLQILNVVGNQLERWSEAYGKGLKRLTELRMGENDLHCLPESFACLQSLRVLEMNDNKLTILPQLIGDLTNLQVLNLNQNHIEDLPDSFSQLSCLYSVDISENRIKFLPNEFKSAEILQYFYVVNNLIKILPPWFEKLYSIIELNLSDNELIDMALPPEFCSASGKTLLSLDLSGNKMTELPNNMGELKNLATFHLGSTICELERRAFQNGNWLKELPDTFSQVTFLAKLHLDENQLVCLPESFGDLVNLEWLDVSQNRINQLPDSFCLLKKLWFFQFSKNKLTALPDNFGELTSLVELRLDSNSLTELPDSFEKLEKLETLDLFSNKMEKIPKVLLKLKNLQRLDLDENKLRIKDDKVPKLTTKVQYAPRNPDLQNNWRGKSRVDKVDFYGAKQEEEESISSLIEKAELEDNLENDNSESTEVLYFNERALEMAMRRGLSIWRSHTGPETRQENSDYVRRFQTSPVPLHERTVTFQPLQEQWSLFFEDAAPQDQTSESSPTINNHDITISGSSHDPQGTEDWDKETEEVWREKLYTPNGLQRKHNPQHIPIRDQLQDVISSYPPARQAYTHSAQYDSVYMKHHQVPDPKPRIAAAKIIEIEHSGQFEDADIQDTV